MMRRNLSIVMHRSHSPDGGLWCRNCRTFSTRFKTKAFRARAGGQIGPRNHCPHRGNSGLLADSPQAAPLQSFGDSPSNGSFGAVGSIGPRNSCIESHYWWPHAMVVRLIRTERELFSTGSLLSGTIGDKKSQTIPRN